MKIAIVTLTTTAKRTGVAEYIINLLKGLQQIDRENEYIVFTAVDNSYMFQFLSGNFKEIRLPFSHSKLMRPVFYAWLIFFLPVIVYMRNINFVHFPNTMFVTGFLRTVSTIHDITEFKTNKYSRIRTFFRWLMLKSAILRSELILTVSTSTLNDLAELGAKNVVSIPLGFTAPSNLRISHDQNTRTLRKYGLENKRYVLFVGTQLRHKNIPALIDAVELARLEIVDLELVIIGSEGNDSGAIRRTIAKARLEKEVHLLSYVGDEDKLLLLRNASVFCFISSYEGFGIPILEAQAEGIPVIASSVSSLPEVGGQGVYLVDLYDVTKKTGKAIVEILLNDDLRGGLIANGQKNIKRFSWENFSRRTLEMYKTLKK